MGLAVAAMVAGCGGSGRAGAEEVPWWETAGPAQQSEHAYPVVWTRPLAPKGALAVMGLYFDPVSGDLVSAGRLYSAAQLAGQRVTPRGDEYDAVVTRYDGETGVQVWTKQISATRRSTIDAIGIDADGNVLVAVYYLGALVDESVGLTPDGRFVAQLDRDDGAIAWVTAYGANETGTIHVGDQTLNIVSDGGRGNIHVYRVDPDGAVLFTSDLAEPEHTVAGLGGAIFTTRGVGGDNELVKLGPCEVEPCLIAVWE
jgi:hypothetical protein